ncbi:MAG: SRPBCC family protein [Acidobacteriota bacterium]|nr:SRPBCC family protein [Acidobacteriota bacterium]
MSIVRALPILVGLAVVAVLLGMAVVGSFLPIEHVVTREVALDRPADEVWELITDFERYPEWVPGLESMEPLIGGRDARLWRQSGQGAQLTIEVVERVPPRRLVTRPADEGLPYSGSWTHEVVPTPGGCRLVVTERGRVEGRLGRFFSRFVFGSHHAVDAFLRAAADRGGTDSDLEPAQPDSGHAGSR